MNLVLRHPHSTTRLAISNPLFFTPRPTSSRRTASAIAIAITQSSCAPSAAAAFPSACRTNVRHSSSSRGLWNNVGSAISTAAIFSIIAGRLAADVSHPNCPSFSKIFPYSMISQVSQHAVSMIVPFHRHQSLPVSLPQIRHPPRQFQRRKVSSQFRALHSHRPFDHLRRTRSPRPTLRPPSPLPMMYCLPFLRRKPDHQPSVVLRFASPSPASPAAVPIASSSNTHSPEARKHELGSSAYSCAARSRNVFHCLRRHAICPRSARAALTNSLLFRSQRQYLPSLPDFPIAFVIPPGKKVLRVSSLLRLLPLLVEHPRRAIRRGLQHNLASPAPPPPATTPAFPPIAGPAGDLRAMQVMDGHPAPRVVVRRFHSILAVEQRKHKSGGHWRATSPARPCASPWAGSPRSAAQY